MSETRDGSSSSAGSVGQGGYAPFDRVRVGGGPTLVVLGGTGIRSVSFEMGGFTMADVYPECPRCDEVLVVAYERALDREVGDWRNSDPARLLEHVGSIEGLHYYPASKLDRYDAGNWTDIGDGIRCEHCRCKFESVPSWVEHFVTECGGA